MPEGLFGELAAYDPAALRTLNRPEAHGTRARGWRTPRARGSEKDGPVLVGGSRRTVRRVEHHRGPTAPALGFGDRLGPAVVEELQGGDRADLR